MFLLKLFELIIAVILTVVVLLIDIGLIRGVLDGARVHWKSVDTWVTLVFIVLSNIQIVYMGILVYTRVWPIVRTGLGI